MGPTTRPSSPAQGIPDLCLFFFVVVVVELIVFAASNGNLTPPRMHGFAFAKTLYLINVLVTISSTTTQRQQRKNFYFSRATTTEAHADCGAIHFLMHMHLRGGKRHAWHRSSTIAQLLWR
jgi:hypothetical protein